MLFNPPALCLSATSYIIYRLGLEDVYLSTETNTVTGLWVDPLYNVLKRLYTGSLLKISTSHRITNSQVCRSLYPSTT